MIAEQYGVSPEEFLTLSAEDLAHHYMKFAAGAYGWPLHIFSDPLASFGLFKVLHKARSEYYLFSVHKQELQLLVYVTYFRQYSLFLGR